MIKSGDYPLENIDLKGSEKLFKESEFSFDNLSAAYSEIKIVLSSKEGKCPFTDGDVRQSIKVNIMFRIWEIAIVGSGSIAGKIFDSFL